MKRYWNKNGGALKLVYIEWGDAMFDPRWIDAKDLVDWIKDANWIVKECGWLMEDNEKYIVLFSAYKESDRWGPRRYNGLKKIPKTWIQKQIDLTKFIEE